MRLDKLLADRGIGSRSQIKELAKKGKITVNDVICKKTDVQIDEEHDSICVNGQSIEVKKISYLMLHKPAGVVSATEDKKEKTVIDLLPVEYHKNFFPVGRLDKDTEGLLLITDDGVLAHNLLSPKKHVPKTYYVEIDGKLITEKIEQLEKGVDIGDELPTKEAIVEECKDIEDGMSFLLTITEGRFHQIKRMVQAVGFQVTYLKRLSMGTLTLDESLPKGAYRPLTKEEIEALILR